MVMMNFRISDKKVSKNIFKISDYGLFDTIMK